MKLGFMLMANYAEDNGGLLYVQGGAWDTVNVRGPISQVPGGPVAIIQGTLVARVLFHVTETDREHEFELNIMDEDGGQVAQVKGKTTISKMVGLPTGWDQGVNLIVPLTGVPLSKFGRYEIALSVDGTNAGTLPFRVLKLY
jgi:hypothetical protein